MNAFRAAFAAGLLAAGGAQAQLVDSGSASQLQAKPSAEARAFARIPLLVEPSYMRNEAENPNDRLMEGFRTDPGRPEDVSGALGVKGFHSYLAARLTGHRLQGQHHQRQQHGREGEARFLRPALNFLS
jgi:hypothetical protein